MEGLLSTGPTPFSFPIGEASAVEGLRSTGLPRLVFKRLWQFVGKIWLKRNI